MAILYDKERRLFHLQSKNTSYAFQILKQGYPAHIYWGRKVKACGLTVFFRSKKEHRLARTLIKVSWICRWMHCRRSSLLTEAQISARRLTK